MSQDKTAASSLQDIIAALEGLESDARRRVMRAAAAFFDDNSPELPEREAAEREGGPSGEKRLLSTSAHAWMRQSNISEAELDKVIHITSDGEFDILDVPGESRRAKSINTYILTGLGGYLTANTRQFDDHKAKRFCQLMGCFDSPNHAKYLKDKHVEFSGDKHRGYELTNEGLKRAALIIKGISGSVA